MRATEHISVRTIKQQIQGASVQANFNYCNDNNLCRSVAHAWYIKEAANVQMGKVVGCS